MGKTFLRVCKKNIHEIYEEEVLRETYEEAAVKGQLLPSDFCPCPAYGICFLQFCSRASHTLFEIAESRLHIYTGISKPITGKEMDHCFFSVVALVLTIRYTAGMWFSHPFS